MTQPDNNIPVRIVCATRATQNEFMEKSPLAISVRSFCAVSPVELKLFPENKVGLAELYNAAIEEALADPAILVFVHDDVFISDYHWSGVIREGLQKFDVVGVVGNTRRQSLQPGWIVTDRKGTLDDAAHLSGAVGQGSQFPPQKLDHFGPAGRECKLLDGLLLAADSRTLATKGLRFDPRFSFHFYDIDFCRSAESLAMKMGTIPLSVVHTSYGSMSAAWHKACDDYFAKWHD